MTQIKNSILKMEKFEWKKLKPLQNENLKSFENQEKLIESVIEHGFIDPIHVWQDEKGTAWICDGWHRDKILPILEERGIEVPQKLNTVFIDCKNKQEASEVLLALSTRVAEVTQDGLDEFILENNLDLERVQKFTTFNPSFDFNQVETDYKFNEATTNFDRPEMEEPEDEEEDYDVTSNITPVILYFPTDIFEHIYSKLDEIKVILGLSEDADNTEVFLAMLENYENN